MDQDICPHCGRKMPRSPENYRASKRAYHHRNKKAINAKQRERMRKLRAKRREESKNV